MEEGPDHALLDSVLDPRELQHRGAGGAGVGLDRGLGAIDGEDEAVDGEAEGIGLQIDGVCLPVDRDPSGSPG